MSDDFDVIKKGGIQARSTILHAMDNRQFKEKIKLTPKDKGVTVMQLISYCDEVVRDKVAGKSFSIKLFDVYNGNRSLTHANLKELDAFLWGVYNCYNYGPGSSQLWASMLDSNIEASSHLCTILGLNFNELSELSENQFKFLLYKFPSQNLVIFSALIDRYRHALGTSKKKISLGVANNPYCELSNFVYFGGLNDTLGYYGLSVEIICKLIQDNSWFSDKRAEQKEMLEREGMQREKGTKLSKRETIKVEPYMVKGSGTQIMPLGVYVLEYLEYITYRGDDFIYDRDFKIDMESFDLVDDVSLSYIPRVLYGSLKKRGI